MPNMTPEQEAAYALEWKMGRDGLSPTVQAEYDRLLQLRRDATVTEAAKPADENATETSKQGPYSPSAHAMHTGPGNGRPYPHRPADDLALRYMRQTRSATVFIAVVVGVVCALSLIAVVIAGVQLASVANQLNHLGGTTTSNSNCASQGGTDTSC